jgi:DNA primase
MMYEQPTEQDIENILNALDADYSSGEEVMARCIWHSDRSPSLRFNTRRGVFICYGCGVKGDFKKLARELGVFVEGTDADNYVEVTIQSVLRMLARKPEGHTEIIQPENYLEQFNNPHEFWYGERGKPLNEFTKCRGFSQDTIKKFELGYDFTYNAATYSVRNVAGKLLGITRRYIVPEDNKYKYFKGFDRQGNLYGAWLVEALDGPVAVCEGALDAVALWDAGYPAVAVYGSSLSPRQIKLLVRLGVEEAILFFDNDDSGYKAKRRAQGFSSNTGRYEQELDLTRYMKVSDVLYPSNLKDPGDASKEQLDLMIETRRVINGW